MQTLPKIVSLVPQSSIQFVDILFGIDRMPRAPRSFWEQPLPPGDQNTAIGLANLRALQVDEEGIYLDPVSGLTPPDEDIYQIGLPQALEPFLNRWVPLPIFRVTSAGSAGKEVFDRGPNNWARIRIVPLATPSEGNTHHAVLAFDTGLRPREAGRPYTTISPSDSEQSSEFVLTADHAATAWFMNERWMALWLEELLRAAQQAGGRRRVEDSGRSCEHWARYICFLEALVEASIIPRIKLVDVVSSGRSYEPINVDFVLDIGNARTCGILVEDDRESSRNFNNSAPLRLRDLTMPERCYAEPFESRVEFTRASFGNETLNRQAGRTNAFQWASPVRVGPEALRLSAAARGTEGSTGLSSPKRYLWDERPTAQVWRFNGLAADGVTTEPPVTGSFMAGVTEEGEVIRGPGRRRRLMGPRQPGMRARFSRSSLMTLLLAEILMQAISQINSVETRYSRSFSDVPRRLRRILLTMPPAMPLAEQRIFRERADAAVRLAWDMLGWGTPKPTTPREPTVMANLDEATATQLVFLYTEASHRLRGDPGEFFALTGRHRDGYGTAPSLRVASIDIGGGTTDLMICTYAAEHRQEIEPKQNFREGFRIAGDEVLQEVLQTIVVPQIEESLAAAGVASAKPMLQEIFGGHRGSQSEYERHLRRQLVAQVLEPVGIAILQAYEKATDRAIHELLHTTIGALLAKRQVDAPVHYLEQQATRSGATGYRLLDTPIKVAADQVDSVVQAVLGPVIADLCEVIHSFDCDWLLLSGRPSRLRAVSDMVLAKMPVPPHRIIGMHHYPTGSWYPFRDPAGRIDDPKTTAAVGAMVCAVAEGKLEGFLLRTSRLAMRSTARFLGRMELSGQILRRNVLLSGLDEKEETAPPTGTAAPVKFEMEFRAPVFLGFRQLDLERWPASRLYILEYTNPDNVPKLKLPLKLSIVRTDMDSDRGDAEELREDFTIDEVVDADKDPQHRSLVRLRLQTEKIEAGYWRDTGALAVP